ncbi:hypothetical protein D3C71_2075990 [compost metagenome]
MDNFIDRPDLGKEVTHQLAQMAFLDFDAFLLDNPKVGRNGAVLQPVSADFVKHRVTASRMDRGSGHRRF